MAQEELGDRLLQAIEERAVLLAEEAGCLLGDFFRRPLAVQFKREQQRSPVTEADRRLEAFLRAGILEAFPEHGILGEEGEDLVRPRSDFLWVLDPIDGTANFINGLPAFGVSIGVLHAGRQVVAALYLPVTPELSAGVFHARAGHGTYLGARRVQVPAADLPAPHRLSVIHSSLWPHFRSLRKRKQTLGEYRSLGSVAYDLALVAWGTLQLAVFQRPKIWDVAAGVLLVQEAGGLVLYQNEATGCWQALERFEPLPRAEKRGAAAASGGVGEGAGKPAEGPLRHWAAPLIAASPALAWFVAQHIGKPRWTHGRLFDIVRHLGRA